MIYYRIMFRSIVKNVRKISSLPRVQSFVVPGLTAFIVALVILYSYIATQPIMGSTAGAHTINSTSKSLLYKAVKAIAPATADKIVSPTPTQSPTANANGESSNTTPSNTSGNTVQNTTQTTVQSNSQITAVPTQSIAHNPTSFPTSVPTQVPTNTPVPTSSLTGTSLTVTSCFGPASDFCIKHYNYAEGSKVFVKRSGSSEVLYSGTMASGKGKISGILPVNKDLVVFLYPADSYAHMWCGSRATVRLEPTNMWQEIQMSLKSKNENSNDSAQCYYEYNFSYDN